MTKNELWMKIMMLGWELPPYNSGGLGVACYQLCKALSKKGVDIEFVLPYTADHNVDFMTILAANPRDAEQLAAAGTAYKSYDYNDGVNPSWRGINDQPLLYEESVEKLVELTEFDIIHAHDWLTFRAALRAKELTRKPLILHVHSIERDRAGGNAGNPLVREIESLAMHMADRIIAVSQHTKDAITNDYGIPSNRIDVVHNSIDLSSVEPLEGNNAYRYLNEMKRHGYKVVVNVGRLTLQKGLPNLLRAAKEVVMREPKTLFLFVGSGEQDRELIELSAELGISRNVIFAGFQRGKNWRDAYAIGDLFVMPSISEPFGLTPLEAAGYGTPSLISKQSGVAEVLKHCLKVDYWDIDEMANLITNAVRNEQLRNELHYNAFSEYQNLSWSGAADRLMDIYQRHLEVA